MGSSVPEDKGDVAGNFSEHGPAQLIPAQPPAAKGSSVAGMVPPSAPACGTCDMRTATHRLGSHRQRLGRRRQRALGLAYIGGMATGSSQQCSGGCLVARALVCGLVSVRDCTPAALTAAAQVVTSVPIVQI